jgi:hypothetical protein
MVYSKKFLLKSNYLSFWKQFLNKVRKKTGQGEEERKQEK